jgi:hypothetical protein
MINISRFPFAVNVCGWILFNFRGNSNLDTYHTRTAHEHKRLRSFLKDITTDHNSNSQLQIATYTLPPTTRQAHAMTTLEFP